MSLCKIQINENGSISGCQEIYAEDDAFWMDGITVDEAFYQTVVIDIRKAVNTWYFDFQTETFINRPELTAQPNKLAIIADNEDLFILTGLPNPCTVTVKDVDSYEVTDEEFSFAVDMPGIYEVTVSRFPYKSKAWEVVAT